MTSGPKESTSPQAARYRGQKRRDLWPPRSERFRQVHFHQTDPRSPLPNLRESLCLWQRSQRRDQERTNRIPPEESYLYKFLNAEETLDFYGRLFDMSPSVRKQRAAELIEMVGLQRAKRRQLKEYSKGMTRRIGLAQALINEPDLLVLDEPTTGLDPIGSREMKDLILKLREQGKTVLMCSHQLADVQDVCDRIAILHQGELKELGRVDSLLKVRGVTEVHAKGLSEEAKKEIAEVIKKHGAEMLQMDNPTTTMEELFLEIVRQSEQRPGHRGSGG